MIAILSGSTKDGDILKNEEYAVSDCSLEAAIDHYICVHNKDGEIKSLTITLKPEDGKWPRAEMYL